MAVLATKSSGFPVELTSGTRFVRWKFVRRTSGNGNVRMTKVPLTADGRYASSTDPSTWGTLEAVADSKHGAGIGFVLGDGIGCVDLDDAIVDGAVLPWAQEIIDANEGTFVEVSQSGNGVHIWGYLDEQPGRVIRDGRSIEVYSAGRYIALGTPMPDASQVLRPLVVPS